MDGQVVDKGSRMYNKEYDRELTEQFILGPSEKGIINEILREVSA